MFEVIFIHGGLLFREVGKPSTYLPHLPHSPYSTKLVPLAVGDIKRCPKDAIALPANPLHTFSFQPVFSHRS